MEKRLIHVELKDFRGRLKREILEEYEEKDEITIEFIVKER